MSLGHACRSLPCRSSQNWAPQCQTPPAMLYRDQLRITEPNHACPASPDFSNLYLAFPFLPGRTIPRSARLNLTKPAMPYNASQTPPIRAELDPSKLRLTSPAAPNCLTVLRLAKPSIALPAVPNCAEPGRSLPDKAGHNLPRQSVLRQALQYLSKHRLPRRVRR